MRVQRENRRSSLPGWGETESAISFLSWGLSVTQGRGRLRLKVFSVDVT